MLRRANKRDINQQQITNALRKAGFSVLDISRCGGAAPDLVVSKKGFTMLVEIKSGNNKPRQNQVEFADNWQGLVMTAHNVNEVLDFYHEWHRSRRV